MFNTKLFYVFTVNEHILLDLMRDLTAGKKNQKRKYGKNKNKYANEHDDLQVKFYTIIYLYFSLKTRLFT